jgi:signal transduction histidine kinase
VLASGRPERVADVSARFGIADEALGVPGTETALLVPLRSRGRTLGVLCAFDRLDEDPRFGDREEELLSLFAQSAATAVATARSVEAERLRHSLRSAEQERTRWARELHDETLQGLAALRVLLQSGLKAGGEVLEDAARQATEQVATEIANLRSMITELRPAALDQLGLEAALEGLASRAREIDGLEVRIAIGVDGEALDPDVRTGVYRLVQEALANVGKHARAEHVEVRVARTAEALEVRVADDGRGFDTAASTEGFGVTGMRERAALMGGDLEISSGPGGTTVRAVLLDLPPAP